MGLSWLSLAEDRGIRCESFIGGLFSNVLCYVVSLNLISLIKFYKALII